MFYYFLSLNTNPGPNHGQLQAIDCCNNTLMLFFKKIWLWECSLNNDWLALQSRVSIVLDQWGDASPVDQIEPTSVLPCWCCGYHAFRRRAFIVMMYLTHICTTIITSMLLLNLYITIDCNENKQKSHIWRWLFSQILRRTFRVPSANCGGLYK